jgi:hypothetical protein
LRGLHFFLGQFVPPRHSGTDSGGGSKLLETEILASRGLVPGVKSSRPPPRIVFWSLQVEVVDVLAHLAAETTSLVMQRAPDDKDSAPQRPVGLNPQEALTKHDKACDMKNGVGIQVMELNPICK